jgi:alpha-mannosidase
MATPPVYYVVGLTHVDMAWKRGFAEMAELLEISVLRILDALDAYPDFRYMIEQAAHFRRLLRDRPDLVARLGPHLRSGRLEFAGAMATTLETNLPHAESLVRNQSLGLRWVRATWDVAPRTAYAADTFGHHAQLPQVLSQFGFTTYLANRCGGATTDELFRARGLDGTAVTVASWNTYAGHNPRDHAVCVCYADYAGLDLLFAQADAMTGPGPRLVVLNTENEFPILLRRFRQLCSARGWSLATPADYLAAVEAARAVGLALPELPADLNPEFTGCFSLRHPLRLRNRAVEALVLDAENLAARSRLPGAAAACDELWWDLAHVHFHDVFTGSHPTSVYHETLALLDRAATGATRLLHAALPASSALPAANATRWLAVNPLPFPRHERLALPNGANVDVALPAGGSVLIDSPPAAAASGISRADTPLPAATAVLANEFLRVELDSSRGLRRLVWVPTGRVLIDGAPDLLLVQADAGSFQIEQPVGTEVGASLGRRTLHTFASADRVMLAGEFPVLDFLGPAPRLRWSITFTLRPGRPALDLDVHLDWRGEAARVRLKIPTTLDTGGAWHEIPFGVVRRHAYTPRANARGEWPAQRWVALEDSTHGLALANTGMAGVESLGGTLFTTLLRAPRAEYAGMVADESSSQHGQHDYRFALLPYAGSWTDAGVVRLAQALNHPPRLLPVAAADATGPAPGSFELSGDASVVFSSLKPADDGSGDLILRCYETAGRPARARLGLCGVNTAHASDLREQTLAPLPVSEGAFDLDFKPFEIRTVRLA